MPPTYLWPVLLLVIPLLVARLEVRDTAKAAMMEGWSFGFGYFCVTLHWIGYAFLVDAATYLWMMPFAVGGLSAVMAVYWAFAGFLAWQAHRRALPMMLALPAALAIAEWLRGHLMTGFPWAAPGLAADASAAVSQLASVMGMTGLTLMVLLWAATPLALVRRGERMEFKIMSALLFAMLPASHVWGQWRLEQHPTQFVEGVALRLVQPNISQESKWRSDNTIAIFDQLIAETEAPSTGAAVTHVIWPESAVPFLLDESAGGRAELARVLGDGKTLITGVIRRSAPNPAADYFTSILVFDQSADVVGVYDKWRLVPGGEFLPFAWILEPLGFRQLVSLPGQFSAGTGPRSIAVPGTGLAGMIICYEAIFPHDLVDGANRPSWIVNVTNDGWFGRSTGPYQHLAQARMRAVEQGLPVIRAANTGISAIIDPVGRTVASLGLGLAGHVDGGLPQFEATTVYSRLGDWSLLVLLLALLIVTLAISMLFSRRLS